MSYSLSLEIGKEVFRSIGGSIPEAIEKLELNHKLIKNTFTLKVEFDGKEAATRI